MSQHIVVDPESKALREHPALVKTPRRNRKRFAEGCVTLVESDADALTLADSKHNLFPALVFGPSISSEGQRIFYLVRWLD